MSDQSTSENKKLNRTGSPQPGEPVYISVGKLRRPHGVKGEMLLDLLTDFPKTLKAGAEVYIGQQYKAYTIRSIRFTDKGALVAFEGLMDCDQVGFLRNEYVFKKTVNAPSLPEGEFFHHEILGMEVLDEAGKSLGNIDEIIETGANDVYVINSGEKGEILIPAIKSVIVEIYREKKQMVVKLPEWE